ncbi:hypothetical protein EXS70_00320 [Candidatus Peribacteria bacterium]|nr:hypothetical protein [Candidatus Peribacteria bacterium]
MDQLSPANQANVVRGLISEIHKKDIMRGHDAIVDLATEFERQQVPAVPHADREHTARRG